MDSGRIRTRARTPQDQEKVRQQFVDAARRVFADDGVVNLTMRRIAAEAGYSAGTIYLYFPGRQDLLRELWKEDLGGLLGAMTAAVTGAGENKITRIRRLYLAYAEFWQERPDQFRAMFLEGDHQYVRERAAFAEDDSVRSIQTFLVTELDAALQASAVRGGDAVLLAHSLLAAVHGVVSLHITSPGFPWAERAAMLEFVLDGLLAFIEIRADAETGVGVGAV